MPGRPESPARVDRVAILHEGRIVRQTETETLRSDVKQIIVDRNAIAGLREHLAILDLKPDGDEVIATIEKAPGAIELLLKEGVTHRVVDLNLDEIFEAYVAGQPTLNDAPKTGEPRA